MTLKVEEIEAANLAHPIPLDRLQRRGTTSKGGEIMDGGIAMDLGPGVPQAAIGIEVSFRSRHVRSRHPRGTLLM